MNAKQMCGVIVALCVAAVAVRADSLELKNGSLIKGQFMSGTQTSISFQVGSSVQSYDVADIRSLRFDSDAQGGSPSDPSKQPNAPSAIEQDEVAKSVPSVTIPAGTRISVRTIDSIDSTRNRVGFRFQASLEEPLWLDGNIVVPKGADVYGRLDESKETGTFAGRSQLKLQLTGIVVNGQTLPLVTGEYEVSGKSKGESTAKRTVGGSRHWNPHWCACRGREGSGHRGRNRCRRGSRLGNYHKGRPSKDPERDPAGFHSATERDNSETRSLIALAQK